MAIFIETSSTSQGRSHDTLTCHTDTIAEHLQSSRNYLNHHHRSCLRINCPKIDLKRPIDNDRLSAITSPFDWSLRLITIPLGAAAVIRRAGQDQGRSIKGGDNGLKCVLRSSFSRAIESDLWNQVVLVLVVVSEIFNWKMPLGR